MSDLVFARRSLDISGEVWVESAHADRSMVTIRPGYMIAGTYEDELGPHTGLLALPVAFWLGCRDSIRAFRYRRAARTDWNVHVTTDGVTQSVSAPDRDAAVETALGRVQVLTSDGGRVLRYGRETT